MITKMRVTGADSLAAAFEELKAATSSGTARAAIRRGLLDAAQIVVKRAQAEVPVKSGRLRASIRARAVTGKSRTERAAYSDVLRMGGSKAQAAGLLRAVRRASKGALQPIMVEIGAMGRGSRAAGLVEFGTSPHTIRPRRKGLMAWPVTRSGPAGAARVVQHPGSRPQPFMRASYEQTKGAVGDHMQETILRELDKSLARARARAARGR